MSIQRRFFLMLLFLSLILGGGIIIPGYLKMRALGFLEAKEYARVSSVRMQEEVARSAEVLERAGVANIQSYVTTSQENLINRYSTSQLDPRVNKFIVDSDGEVLVQTASEDAVSFDSELFSALGNANENTIEYRNEAGSWLVSAQKNDTWGWQLVSSMPAKEVYRESRDYLQFVVLISALVLLLVFALYFFFTRQLRQRIKLMMEQFELYKQGNFEKRLKVTNPDEISTLQQSINAIIDSVEMEIVSRRSNEQVLSQEKSKAENINIEKAEYLADISYQIKNPITSVVGYAALLASSKLDATQNQYAANIQTASAQIEQLVDQIFDQSTPTSSPVEFDAADPAGWQERLKMLEEVEILLVESDKLNKQYACDLLSHHAIEVHALDTAKQAINHLDEHDVDLLLISIDSTDDANEKLIKHVRKYLPAYMRSIPVIVITTNASQSDISRYIGMGASATVAKPFSPQQLINVIAQQL